MPPPQSVEEQVAELRSEAEMLRQCAILVGTFSQSVEGFATSVHAMSENADRSQAVLQGWIGMFVKPKGPEEKLAKGAGHQGGMRRVTINSEIEERDAKTRRGRVEPAANPHSAAPSTGKRSSQAALSSAIAQAKRRR